MSYLTLYELQGLMGSMGRTIKDDTLDTGGHYHHHQAVMNTDFECPTEPEPEESPEIDIIISNVVCCFSVRCHLNLREIGIRGSNVKYEKGSGLVRMRLRKPTISATITSSGKITCFGAKSEDEAKQGARRIARILQKLGFKVRLDNYRIVNVLGSCVMPWAIKIEPFSSYYREVVQYEPEIKTGAIYKIGELKATVNIYSTGRITVTAPSIGAVQQSIEQTYPMVFDFQRARTIEEQNDMEKRKRLNYAVVDGGEDSDGSEES